jgi:predicted phosphodiesterase
MKIIAIGDIHGRSKEWKQIAGSHTFDKLIFIGDYWDSFNIPYIEQLHNFREICQFKEEHPDKVVLLIGNHEFHYLPVAGIYEEQYSGYQKKKAMEIGYELQRNLHLFQMAYQQKLRYDTCLFTHAGVTKTWFKSTLGLMGGETLDFGEAFPVDQHINDVFKHKPQLFLFQGNDPYGDDITQSPIWVRPQSLNEDALDYVHVVGHTSQRRIGVEPTKFLNGGSGFFIDTLGSSGEYLVIEDGKIHIEKV